jgi:regulator of sigma E protease
MWLLNTLIFIALLSTLIVVHEFGHFFAARISGIVVERFAIGFGPIIFRKKLKQTLFLICAVPFGGYVKLKGDSRDESKGEPDEFLSKSLGVKARVVFFGPLANYFFSFLLLCFLFMVGMPYLDSVIGEVTQDSPAQIAGLQDQDRIVEINGAGVDDWRSLQHLVRSSSGPIDLLVLRDQEQMEFTIKPETKRIEDVFGKERLFPVIGVRPAYKVKIAKYNLFGSFYRAGERLIELTTLIVKGFYYIFTGAIPVKDSLAGPIELYRITSYTAKEGLTSLLSLMSVIGVSLALVNLFPIPVLDGGHLFIFLIEKLRKKPLAEKTENIVTRIGIAMIGALMFFVIYNDISRLTQDKINHDGQTQSQENENSEDR